MKKVGIICAIEKELKPYLEVLEDQISQQRTLLTFSEGKIADTNVVIVYSGVCKVNAAIAAQVMIEHFAVDYIIISGTAGGLDNRLVIGDTVISTKVMYHDMADGILTQYHPWMQNNYFSADQGLVSLCSEIANAVSQGVYFGSIVTGESFIDQEGRDKINQRFAPLCVDMETAAITHVCYANRMPWIAVRSISDTEEQSGEGNFALNCELAARNSFSVVKLLLTKIK